MNNKQIITLVIILLVIVVGFIAYQRSRDESGAASPLGLRECPDEMIINRMPGTEPQSSYYIKDGARREISEYDAAWVSANCQVPIQEVF